MLNTPNPSLSRLDTDCETHLALLNQLDAEAFCGMRQLIDMNLVNTTVTPEQVNTAMQQLTGRPNPVKALPASSASHPAAAVELQTQLLDCAHAQFARCVGERLAAMHQTLTDLLDDAIHSAPGGAQQEIAPLQQALEGIDAAYAQCRKAIEACEPAMYAV